MKIVVGLGTRPEAIKLAPLIRELQLDESLEVYVLATGQHPNFVREILELFEIKVDLDLNTFVEGQVLGELFSKLVGEINKVLEISKPDLVVVQGDTASTLALALASFFLKIPVYHVEAGLRTDDPSLPFPEEMNRRLVTQIADKHFPPTKTAYQALVKESVDSSNILLTGNTGIDAALFVTENGKSDNKVIQDVISKTDNSYVLVTIHRREAWNEGIFGILKFLAGFARKHPRKHFVFVTHPNPKLQKIVKEEIGEIENIIVLEPQNYPNMVTLVKGSIGLLTDSGGLQEEAAFFRLPCLVAREETERVEGITAGFAEIVGFDLNAIENGLNRIFLDSDWSLKLKKLECPYGDGFASKKIVAYLLDQTRRE